MTSSPLDDAFWQKLDLERWKAEIHESMTGVGIEPGRAHEAVDLAFHHATQAMLRVLEVRKLTSSPQVALPAVTLALSVTEVLCLEVRQYLDASIEGARSTMVEISEG